MRKPNGRASAASSGGSGSGSVAVPVSRGRRGFVATMMIVVGLAIGALWLVVMLMQVQTNEALILSQGTVDVFRPNLSLLLQIPDLFTGGLSPSEALAAVYGWGIELLVLGLTIGYEIIHVAMHQASVLMARIFRLLALIAVGLNLWSDFNYGTLGSGFLGHLLFACFCSGVVGIGGIAAATLIKHGIENA